MNQRDVYRLAYKALKDRKLRSALTILGIVIGAAMITALVASTRGLTASVSAQINKIGVTTITVFPVSARTLLSDEDVAAVRDFTGVTDVIPYYQRRMTISYATSSISILLYGLDQTKIFRLYNGLAIARGNLVDEYDPTGVVIGSSLADPPEGSLPSVNINELILLQSQSGGTTSRTTTLPLLVKGILAPYGSAGFANIDETAFMTLTAARLLLRAQYYNGLYIIAERPDGVPSLVTTVQNYFGTNARVISSSFLLESVQSITNQLTLFLGGVGAISLFVAGVGITNTMFVSVMERTREIGIMKAIGFRPRNILGMFLAEAVLTGIIGGILGTILGTTLSFMLGGALPGLRFGGPPGAFRASASSSSFQPQITPDLIVFSLFFPVIISLVAGLYPAWKGSMVNPVIALKYE